jgi:soluble lytic murein transglycosylase
MVFPVFGAQHDYRTGMPQRPTLTAKLRLALFCAALLPLVSMATMVSVARAGEPTLPQPLSATDAKAYRAVFALQAEGKWGTAAKIFNGIEDKSLESHVLYQRYMHPTKYRSRFSELKKWLTRFADRPGADNIRDLALKRRPNKNALVPPLRLPRISGVLSEEAIASGSKTSPDIGRRSRSWSAEKLARKVDSLVARRSPSRALALISDPKNQKILGKNGFARAEAAVARGFYHVENNKRALEMASAAAKNAPDGFADAHWWAGLASWRLEQYDQAAGFFAAIADSDDHTVSMRTAAGFWAARSYLQSAHPNKVNHYLGIAAQRPRTFYGLLAANLLGYSPEFNWRIPPLTDGDRKRMLADQRLRRTLALVQIGELVRADAEMKYMPFNKSEQYDRILLNVAVLGALPRAGYRLGHVVFDDNGDPYDAALYPVPAWRPKEGFIIDRALIYALIRQESRFHARARSYLGASGLMQLMPSTARTIASRKEWNGRRSALLDPVRNITLGQKYVRHLLDHAVVEGDLFYAIAAYNGGPGNLFRWRKKIDYRSDALLFIESIPARETRVFIENVLTNLWIYRLRLNQTAPSLGTLAAGGWPTYTALDRVTEKVSSNAK